MATLTNLTGRVLIQIGDNEPVEVATIEIPIEIVPQKPNQQPHFKRTNYADANLGVRNTHPSDINKKGTI